MLLRYLYVLMKHLYDRFKRGADIAGAAALLAASFPVWIASSIIIKAESPGPVLFVHKRKGLMGKELRVYKFRSMSEGADDLEASLTDEETERYYKEYRLDNDPRVTRAGRFLRRTYMDELPQLINILEGDMSLVGPRPVTEEELSFYSDSERKKLLSVKPGLTGYWQVFGKRRATYQNGRRQQMELYYADNASLALDIRILLRTPAVVIRGNV